MDMQKESVSVELPCGLVEEGKFIKEAAIVPMTGLVRKLIARPEVRENPAKILDALLLNCVVRIGANTKISKKVLDQLLIADREFLSLKIRIISKGDVLESRLRCPSCKEMLGLKVSLSEVPIKPLPECKVVDNEVLITLEGEGYKAVCRLPNGADQFAVAPLLRKNPVEANYALFSRCLKSWNGKPREELSASFFDELGVQELDDFTQKFIEAQPGPEFTRPTVCYACGEEMEVSLESSDFLYPLPKTERT